MAAPDFFLNQSIDTAVIHIQPVHKEIYSECGKILASCGRAMTRANFFTRGFATACPAVMSPLDLALA